MLGGTVFEPAKSIFDCNFLFSLSEQSLHLQAVTSDLSITWWVSCFSEMKMDYLTLTESDEHRECGCYCDNCDINWKVFFVN
jgi:hypothetical protein